MLPTPLGYKPTPAIAHLIHAANRLYYGNASWLDTSIQAAPGWPEPLDWKLEWIFTQLDRLGVLPVELPGDMVADITAELARKRATTDRLLADAAKVARQSETRPTARKSTDTANLLADLNLSDIF